MRGDGEAESGGISAGWWGGGGECGVAEMEVWNDGGVVRSGHGLCCVWLWSPACSWLPERQSPQKGMRRKLPYQSGVCLEEVVGAGTDVGVIRLGSPSTEDLDNVLGDALPGSCGGCTYAK